VLVLVDADIFTDGDSVNGQIERVRFVERNPQQGLGLAVEDPGCP